MRSTTRWWAGPLAMLIAMATGPALTAQEAPLLDVALGDAYESNFNDDAGGFTASDVPPPPPPPTVHDWAHGVPTSGPGVAFSGTNVWATNLGGLYRNNHCGAIMSPPIDLTSATSASASFMQWRHLERSTATGTIWDAGRLFVTSDGGQTFTSISNPSPAYDTGTLGTTAATCLRGLATSSGGYAGPVGTTPPAPTYSRISADLSSFAGQTVQFVIAMGSDGTGQRAGWYIDDFSLTVDGTTTVQDFEIDAGGFTTLNWAPAPLVPLGWSHGIPASGPSGVDGSAWATNLSGLYGINECASITSGPIDLSHPAATKATMSWKQWFRANSTAAGGVVQASSDGSTWKNLVPIGGYPGTSNPTALDPCLGNVSQGSRGFFGALQTVGTPMVDQQIDLTPLLGSESVQLRFLFASTSSTSRNEGWYVDDLTVSQSFYVAQPVLPSPQAPDLGAALGWKSGGANSSWAYGTPTAAGGPEGEIGYVTNLTGLHNPNECSYIESPAVPGSVFAGSPALTFDQWYVIGSAFSLGGTAFDGGAIQTSVDGGATWQYLSLPEYNSTSTSTDIENCLAAGNDRPVFVGNKPTMHTVTADLSALAGAPSVKVRFLLATTSVVHNKGWFVKNVNLGGLRILP